MAYLTTLRTSNETTSLVLQNNPLESHPQFLKDLLMAIMESGSCGEERLRYVSLALRQ